MELKTINNPSIKSSNIDKKTYVKIDIEESKVGVEANSNEKINHNEIQSNQSNSANNSANNSINNPTNGCNGFLWSVLFTIFVWNFLASIGSFAGFIRY